MSLACLTLSLLCARPAHAQGGSPGWDIVYSYGPNSQDAVTMNGHQVGPWAWGSLNDQYLTNGLAVSATPGNSASITGSGTFVATLTWDAHGTGQSPPPHIYLAVSTSASFGGTATGTADDGLNDPLLGDISQGTHIEGPFDTSSGTVTYSLPMSCSCSVSVPVGGYITFIKVGHSMTVAVTDRQVRIIPNMGTTYHKGVAGLPQANVADSNGTVTDDTVAPAYNNPRLVQPYGAAIGAWGANSGYNWSQNCPGSALSALANPGTVSGIVGPSGAIPAYIVTYSRHSDFSNPILSNIHLVVKDGVDDATAAADYYVNFHNEYENKIQLTDGRVYGPLTQVSGYFQSGPNGGNFPLPVTGSVSVTVSIVPGGGVSTFLAQAYNVTDVGATYSSPPHNAPLPMPKNKYCWIVDQAYFEQITGTVDNYETSGFQSTISWIINRAYHPGNPLVDYGEQLVASDSPPPTK